MANGAGKGQSVLDSGLMRLLALAVLLSAAALVAFYHRADLFPAAGPAADAGINPHFVACRDQRLGQVDTMRSDGLIDDAKVGIFRERALAYCAAQFPPDGPAGQ